MKKLAELCKDHDADGKLSAGRTPLIAATTLLLLAWLVLGVAIVVREDVAWSDVSGWLTWGRDFLFVTVLNAVGMKVAGKLKGGST